MQAVKRLAYRRCAAFLAALLTALVAAPRHAFSEARAAGCGLPQAAFCENFESGPAAVSDRGRGNELSRTRFSASRYAPSLSTGDGETFWAWEGELGMMDGEPDVCRAGLPTFFLPSTDTLVCEPNATIGSGYLLGIVGSQNYGSNGYRIRQPFDFANRTGRIVFDADLSNDPILLGYLSVTIAEDPTPTPSWDLNGRGPNPRNGLMIVFVSSTIDVHDVRDQAMTTLSGPVSTPPSQRGHLSRVELRLSRTALEVLTSEPSPDGLTFGAVVSRRSVTFPQPLTFTRGYVTLVGHNHATWKYAITYAGLPRPMPSWNTYWDNIGFDGPAITNTREYEIPDAGIPSNETTIDEHPPGTFTTVLHHGLSLGYTIPDGENATGAPLTFSNVSMAGATRARLVFNGYYQGHDNNEQLRLGNGRLRYRINDHPRHDRAFTPGEIAMLDEPGQTGGFNHSFDIPLSELHDGDNSVRFSTLNIESGYPNAVVNLDLLIDFDPDPVFFDSFELPGRQDSSR